MYLIDTDTIIYSLKADETVTTRFAETSPLPKSISVITYGELAYGARKSQHPERNLATVSKVAELFPMIEVDRATIETFATIKSTLEKSGTPLDDMDLLIAATALTENLVLVTNNLKHFRRINGLRIENWKTGESVGSLP